MATLAAEAPIDASGIGFAARHVARCVCRHEVVSTENDPEKNHAARRTTPRVQACTKCTPPLAGQKATFPLPQTRERSETQRKRLGKPRPGHVVNTTRNHEGVMANHGHHDKQEKETNNPTSQQAEGPPAKVPVPATHTTSQATAVPGTGRGQSQRDPGGSMSTH
jgi:hypothetical protein